MRFFVHFSEMEGKNGQGTMPLASAGDVFNPGEATELEFYECQRVSSLE